MGIVAVYCRLGSMLPLNHGNMQDFLQTRVLKVLHLKQLVVLFLMFSSGDMHTRGVLLLLKV